MEKYVPSLRYFPVRNTQQCNIVNLVNYQENINIVIVTAIYAIYVDVQVGLFYTIER